MNSKRRGPVFAAVIVKVAAFGAMLIAFGLGTMMSQRATAADEGQSEAESLSASFRSAARKAAPAVVSVRVVGAPDPLELRRLTGERFEPSGSGVVIDAERGAVVTNNDVVPPGGKIFVTLRDGREREAREVRRDPKSDLAVLLIDPKGLTQADWGDSDALETGDWVLAVGQPFGLPGTVTAGIISGTGRALRKESYEDLIQTDAAINPGNSGGPLINLKGQIVGINTAIKTLNGGYEGVGLVVPGNRAKRASNDLLRFGWVRRAQIGINAQRIDPPTGERLDSPGAVAVTAVAPDGPAQRAGLRPGDVVTKIGGKALDGIGMLQGLIESASIGEPLTLTVIRGAEPARDLAVLPAAVPEPLHPDERGPMARGAQGDAVEPTVRLRDWGLELAPSAAGARGLRIVAVAVNSPADRGGLEANMVLLDVAGRPVASFDDLKAARRLISAAADSVSHRDLSVRVLKGAKIEHRLLVGAPVAPMDPDPAAPSEPRQESPR